jgi:hypothetical protein
MFLRFEMVPDHGQELDVRIGLQRLRGCQEYDKEISSSCVSPEISVVSKDYYQRT